MEIGGNLTSAGRAHFDAAFAIIGQHAPQLAADMRAAHWHIQVMGIQETLDNMESGASTTGMINGEAAHTFINVYVIVKDAREHGVDVDGLLAYVLVHEYAHRDHHPLAHPELVSKEKRERLAYAEDNKFAEAVGDPKLAALARLHAKQGIISAARDDVVYQADVESARALQAFASDPANRADAALVGDDLDTLLASVTEALNGIPTTD